MEFSAQALAALFVLRGLERAVFDVTGRNRIRFFV
jgi:hypothetical protein